MDIGGNGGCVGTSAALVALETWNVFGPRRPSSRRLVMTSSEVSECSEEIIRKGH
jgi:hypothetical protein